MRFEFLSDENDIKKVINLIKDTFNISNIPNIELLKNPRFVILKKDDDVIGTSMLTIKYDPIKNIKTLYIDYVCVDKKYQHMGYGKEMFLNIEKIAKEEGIDYLELTSNKKRVYAREMYLKLGMEIKDTDIFIKKIS
jgi:ribosomal protein S18 acetylase RimI-like enzyme